MGFILQNPIPVFCVSVCVFVCVFACRVNACVYLVTDLMIQRQLLLFLYVSVSDDLNVPFDPPSTNCPSHVVAMETGRHGTEQL